MVKHNSLVNRFDDDFTVKFEEFTAPARIDEKQPTAVIMPVKEEAFVSVTNTVESLNNLPFHILTTLFFGERSSSCRFL